MNWNLVNKWICQYNPKRYELQKAAEDPDLEYMDLLPTRSEVSHRRKPNAKRLKKGDLCLFWRSGVKSGFVGYGIVKKEQATRAIPEEYNRYEMIYKMGPVEEIIEITYEKLFDPPILRTKLEEDAGPDQVVYRELFRGSSQGTFFELTDAAWGFLEKYLCHELVIPEGSSISEFTETILDLNETSELPEPIVTDPLHIKRTTIQRIIRDKKFSDTIKKLYDYRCAICGKRRFSLKNIPEVDAAHIKPKEKGGPDDFRNGIALCKWHHWAFDGGLFSISEDRTIVVHPSIKGGADYEDLYDLEGKEILLPKPLKYAPDPKFLKEHPLIYDFGKKEL